MTNPRRSGLYGEAFPDPVALCALCAATGARTYTAPGTRPHVCAGGGCDCPERHVEAPGA